MWDASTRSRRSRGCSSTPNRSPKLAAKVAEISSAQFVVTRTDHDDDMEMRVVLKNPAAASDALIARIVETARAITRLRGEVRFIATTEVEEPDKKIIDLRKWD